MKKLIFLAAGLLVASGAGAQHKWTLRECIDHAVENNIEIRQTALGVENAAIELNTTQNSRLPDLNAGLRQSVGFGRTQIPYTDPESDLTYTRLEDAVTTSSSASISSSMPIFGGFRIKNQIEADRLDLRAAAEGLEKAKQSLEVSVAGFYLDVLFKKEILAVYREQTSLTRQQVARTAAMVEEGKVARSQLYEIEAQLAQNEVSEVNAANDLALSLLNLSQALNLGHVPDFDIADVDTSGLTPDALGMLRSPDDIYEVAVGIRPVVREAQLRLESSEYGVKVARSAYWPSLSLGIDLSDGYYRVFGKKMPQDNFATQLRNNHSESVGLNLSIPIFNRNATRNNVRSARLGVQNQILALEGVKLALFKEIQQAWQGAMSAGARYEATSKALTAATEAFRAMELRYESGKATVYEYSDAHTKLLSSRSEQTQAKYDYLFRTKILDFYTGQEIEI